MHDAGVAGLPAALSAVRTQHLIAEADRARVVAAARGRRDPRGEIRLRPLTAADAHHMSALLERLSPQSRYLRYFRIVRSFTPVDVARFVAVSADHQAVGAFDQGDLVGTAQYFRSPDRPDHAEVAVEVADTHHRRRIAARLVDELARLATDEGITRFTATVLTENRAVLGLLQHSGWEVATTWNGSYADVVVTLPPEPVGAGAGGAVPLRASSSRGTPREADGVLP